ncbi:MAG: hypothetical protein DRN99_01990 [Thermoproteota archaeon]|nr:MAG: hypothetical protein DRN99_01990 [Candidatus Korarchaeota archaeon]
MRWGRGRREEVERRQEKRINWILRFLRRRSRFYRGILGDLGAAGRISLSEFKARVPLLDRGMLAAEQRASPPFGGLSLSGLENCISVGMTGYMGFSFTGQPVRVPVARGDLEHCGRLAARVFREAGVRRGWRVYVLEDPRCSTVVLYAIRGARLAGGSVIQVGAGRTLRTVRFVMSSLPPAALWCTPTYAYRVAEVASSEGAEVPVKAVAGWGELGFSVQGFREKLAELWSASAGEVEFFDVYAMGEAGVLGCECSCHCGVHLFEDYYLFEVVDPETGEPCEGRGELVFSQLYPASLPLLRYRTGDLVEVDWDRCSCGRVFARVRVLGRVEECRRLPEGFESVSELMEALASAGVYDPGWRYLPDRGVLAAEEADAARRVFERVEELGGLKPMHRSYHVWVRDFSEAYRFQMRLEGVF